MFSVPFCGLVQETFIEPLSVSDLDGAERVTQIEQVSKVPFEKGN